MLQKLGFAPGFNKQVTETGAEGQWFDGDNVRFRYGTPEKIGGWTQLGDDKLTGAARAIHHWDDNSGIKYAAIGTNRILYVYSGGVYYDIHPIRTTLTGATFTSTLNQNVLTITCSGVHGLAEQDIVMLDSVTIPASSSYTAADFEDKKFMVTAIPTTTTFTITMTATETGTPMSTTGSTSVLCYYHVGPAQQLGGFGWGTGLYGGTALGAATTTLATAITDLTTTDIVLANTAAFPSSGEIRIGTEDISFTSNNTSTNTLSGGARGVNGTTKATHSGGASVLNISDYVAWGDPSNADFTIEPGLWVLDNYGTKLIALIYNGQCFEWDASASNATSVRATLLANAPTASRHVLVSTPDRHLVFFGTETTVGNTATQDDMFIRFSSQESIDQTDSYTVKANNTAGTQRLADGSKIMGAIKGRDAIYVWTDTALFLMKFVGQPFTFSFEQVGTNCGLFGKNACIEVDGSAYWMSENGFFTYDGQLKSLPCLVEDHVYDDINAVSRDLINAGLNNLFGEISWFYCTSASDAVNRVVTYNYLDSNPKRPIWTTGTLPRTAWQDSAVFDKPHATFYDSTDNASTECIGNTDGITIYYKQETGTDQINAGGATTAIIGTITSGDFDITQRRNPTGQTVGMPDLRGDGEFIMRIQRFIPDFISQTGNTRVSFVTRNYPNSSATTTNFDVSSTTTKKDTRLRARSIAIKVANTTTNEDWKLGTFRLDIAPGVEDNERHLFFGKRMNLNQGGRVKFNQGGPGFYNQADQKLYAGGLQYLPQEQYRLGLGTNMGQPNMLDISGSSLPTGIMTQTNKAVAPYPYPMNDGSGGKNPDDDEEENTTPTGRFGLGTLASVLGFVTNPLGFIAGKIAKKGYDNYKDPYKDITGNLNQETRDAIGRDTASTEGRGQAAEGSGYDAGNECFEPNTLIQMANGSEKKIKDIQLGDDTRGGEVTGVFKFKPSGNGIYNYKNVTVAGSHFVKEDGKFIMVKDSPLAVKINKIPIVYSLDTTGRRIFINNIEFADYNGDGVAKSFLSNAGADLTGFDKEVLRQVEHRLI